MVTRQPYKTPVHTYNSYGNFTVTLIVANAFGCTDTLIKPNYIRVQRAVISIPWFANPWLYSIYHSSGTSDRFRRCSNILSMGFWGWWYFHSCQSNTYLYSTGNIYSATNYYYQHRMHRYINYAVSSKGRIKTNNQFFRRANSCLC